MKTYNTIEDILNDHELMEKPVDAYLIDLVAHLIIKGFPEDITGETILDKANWLKSEYERRQKELKDNQGKIIVAQGKFEPMEKKPNLQQCVDLLTEKYQFQSSGDAYAIMALVNEFNKRKVGIKAKPMENNLIPFDLEKAKAGAKVWVKEEENRYESKIVFEDNESILVVYNHNQKNYCRWFYKGGFDYEDLLIESEPLPEMWMPVFKTNSIYLSSAIFQDKGNAEEFAKSHDCCVGIAKLVFE